MHLPVHQVQVLANGVHRHCPGPGVKGNPLTPEVRAEGAGEGGEHGAGGEGWPGGRTRRTRRMKGKEYMGEEKKVKMRKMKGDALDVCSTGPGLMGAHICFYVSMSLRQPYLWPAESPEGGRTACWDSCCMT